MIGVLVASKIGVGGDFYRPIRGAHVLDIHCVMDGVGGRTRRTDLMLVQIHLPMHFGHENCASSGTTNS
jgi:hypothetical protein